MIITKDIDIEKIKAKRQKYLDDMRKMLEEDKFMEQVEVILEKQKNAPPKEIKPKTPEELQKEAAVFQERTEQLMLDFFADAENLAYEVKTLKAELAEKDKEIAELKRKLAAIEAIILVEK